MCSPIKNHNIRSIIRHVHGQTDNVRAKNARLTSIVVVLAETTEEEDVCVLGRRRAGGDEVKSRDTDELK